LIQSTGRNNLTNGDSSTVSFAGTDATIGTSVNTSGLTTPNAFTALEKALFSHPTAGSAGHPAQRFFTDASFWILESSVFKSFRTPWFAGEDPEVQLRFELFNTTNSKTFNQFNRNGDGLGKGDWLECLGVLALPDASQHSRNRKGGGKPQHSEGLRREKPTRQPNLKHRATIFKQCSSPKSEISGSSSAQTHYLFSSSSPKVGETFSRGSFFCSD